MFAASIARTSKRRIREAIPTSKQPGENTTIEADCVIANLENNRMVKNAQACMHMFASVIIVVQNVKAVGNMECEWLPAKTIFYLHH